MSAFWDDHNADMLDPEYRAEWEALRPEDVR